MLHSTK